MTTIDTLLSPRWIVPIKPHNRFFENWSIAIDKGKIIDLLPTDLAKKKFHAHQTLDLPKHVIMPGLVNAHTHSPMSLLRGLADDLPLMTWLKEYIWPAEGKWMNDDYIIDGTKLAIAEMLKSGTTCFQEHYFYTPTIAKVAEMAKIRSVVGILMIGFKTPWAKDFEESVAKSLGAVSKYHNHSLVKINLAPHAPYSLDDRALMALRDLAEKYQLPIHMHVHESVAEINESLKLYGCRPLARMEKLGLFEFPFCAVHMTQLDESDYAILRKHPTISVVHCPRSNLKLANDFCPTAKLQNEGVVMGLGTDSAASNNRLDIFAEMQMAALIAKGITRDPTVLHAEDVLYMATLGGAKVLGLEKEIGSIEVGKWADIIAIDMDFSKTQPVYNPISHLVYVVSGSQVSDVWVAGERLVDSGKLTTLNERAILDKAEDWRGKIAMGKSHQHCLTTSKEDLCA